MMNEIFGRLKTATKRLSGLRYDALDLLRADHMKAEAALVELRLLRNKDHRKRLFKKIRKDLERHMWIEEEFFYPVCEQIPELQNLMDDSHEDHQLVKAALEDLDEMNPTSERFNKLLDKLIIGIERHVYAEENKVFPVVRAQVKRAAFKRLSDDMIGAFDSRRASQARHVH